MERFTDSDLRNAKTAGFFSGLLIGGVVGSSIALLQASRSGAETRRQLRDKAIELQQKTERMVAGAESKVEQVGDQIVEQIVDRTEELESHGKVIAGSAEKAIKTAKDETRKAIQAVTGS